MTIKNQSIRLVSVEHANYLANPPGCCQPYYVTNAKLKAQREYRRKHRLRYIAHSKAWKDRNPDWWKGRKLVQLLTSALINGNAKSKVFKDAGMTFDDWIQQSPTLNHTGNHSGHIMLCNGSKLAPIKSWREFDRKSPDRVKQFLAPANFKLVNK